jgi:hypothetical protein
MPDGRSPCPGCGAFVEGSAELRDPRSLASWGCYQAYGLVAGYELEHVTELGRWHQLLVDTYSAQHVAERTPRMTVAFALLGLRLALEDGRSGLEVRQIHQRLAAARVAWPALPAPADRGGLTVEDLRAAASPADYAERLHAWARSVWESWAPEHPAVNQLRADLRRLGERPD